MENDNIRNTEFTPEWIMAKMDAIIHDNVHITEALQRVSQVPPSEGLDCKAEAIAKIVAAREATNQQVLQFLEKVYSSLNPAPQNAADILKSLDMCVLSENLESEHVVEVIKAIAGRA